MASDKDEKKNSAQSNQVVEGPTVSPPDILAIEVSTAPVTPVSQPRAFRDTVFTSRTLIMPDGRSLAVSKGLVAAFGDDQFDYLSKHPDFELIED